MDSFDQRDFAFVRARNHQDVPGLFRKAHGNRKRAPNRLQQAIERKFPHDNEVFKLGNFYFAGRNQQPDGKRQIQGASFFPQIRGRQVHRSPETGHHLVDGTNRRNDTFPRFPYRVVG